MDVLCFMRPEKFRCYAPLESWPQRQTVDLLKYLLEGRSFKGHHVALDRADRKIFGAGAVLSAEPQPRVEV